MEKTCGSGLEKDNVPCKQCYVLHARKSSRSIRRPLALRLLSSFHVGQGGLRGGGEQIMECGRTWGKGNYRGADIGVWERQKGSETFSSGDKDREGRRKCGQVLG